MDEMWNDDDEWVEGTYCQDIFHAAGYGYPDYPCYTEWWKTVSTMKGVYVC